MKQEARYSTKFHDLTNRGLRKTLGAFQNRQNTRTGDEASIHTGKF